VHPDLEAIVSADEEARSRVALEEQRRTRELAAARSERDAGIESRRREVAEALERDLRMIAEDGDARIAQMQRQQAQFLAALAATGERRLEEAVALFLSLVGEVRP
jgi:hypothetical protein